MNFFSIFLFGSLLFIYLKRISRDNYWTRSISGNYNYNIVITQTNKIYVWGDNDYGKLGLAHTTDITVPTQIFLI